MSSRRYRLGELLEITSSKRIHMKDYVSFGVPFYRGKEVIERAKGYCISTELFISSEQHEELKLKFGSPQDGDILLTSVGTLGVPYYIFGDGDFYFKDGNVTWFRNFSEKVNSKFLFYWLASPTTQRRLDEISIGSTQRALTISALKSLEILLPDISLQQVIVSVLDALSDRITFLRETNATLESIAQALFKSWFVDFDPVRAKMEGRAPEGMDEATAALFPDSFEESELGLVPRGWNAGSFSNLIRLHKGTINPGAHADLEFQHFSLPAFDNGQMPIVEYGALIKSNKTTVPKEAVLLSKLNPHIPRVWLPSSVVENAICSTEFLPFVPTGPASTAFVYCLLKTPGFSLALRQLVTGTSNSHQRVKADGVLSLRSVVPPATVVAAFDSLASSLLSRLRQNRVQATTLVRIRDTLLHRLISGQRRLSEEDSSNIRSSS